LKQELRILLDENIGLKVYRELRRRGYNVQSMLVERRGVPDEEIIETAIRHHKIIVTMDKDFGYLAQAYRPLGVVILRLRDPRIPNRIRVILRTLSLGEQLYGYITIVTENRIRKRPITP